MKLRNTYKTAIVTGTSSGIGQAVCRSLAADGIVVHALARRADRLDTLAQETGAIAHVVDVSDTQALSKTVEGIEPDILINNVGFSQNARFDNFPPEKIGDISDVNVRSTMQLTRMVPPGIRERNRGHIVFTGSCAGITPMAGSAPYAE
ncbi:MAG: SDR family oxidoreductase [Yoonia sp.]|uniref:SDR family oxidoreductase n=1 Tax=Yoonia sp. TaxID=2212373 RepID=UPI003EF6F1C9